MTETTENVKGMSKEDLQELYNATQAEMMRREEVERVYSRIGDAVLHWTENSNIDVGSYGTIEDIGKRALNGNFNAALADPEAFVGRTIEEN